jgi:hypothetical protein
VPGLSGATGPAGPTGPMGPGGSDEVWISITEPSNVGGLPELWLDLGHNQLKYWDPGTTTYVPLPSGGTVILSGTTTPTSGTGAEGNFYLDTDDHILYGPKTGTSWPVAIAQSAPAPEQEFVFNTAESPWRCVHNLNEWSVDVQCWDAGNEEVIGDVDVTDANEVNIYWNAPMTGRARVSR